MDRKDFFSSGIKELGRKAYNTAPGRWLDQNLQAMSNLLSPAWGFGVSAHEPGPTEDELRPFPKNRGYPRPPGARSNPLDFQKACTACGDCIVACPYGAIFSVPDVHGPVLDPNHIPCHLCEDFPCIEACPEEALLPLGSDTLPGFGTAEVHLDACLNRERPKGGKKCKLCQEVCPVEDTVSYDRKGLPSMADHCTGCGVCVEQCPTGAIQVLWS